MTKQITKRHLIILISIDEFDTLYMCRIWNAPGK